jgi:nicotinamidase-related amidase
MPISRLAIDNTVLIVIDVQERLLPTIVDGAKLTANCAALLRMAYELGIPAIVTEQYVKGLGRTVEEVAQAMPNPAARVEKSQFSAIVDVVDEQLTMWGRSSVLVAGLEAHVCVLQTVLDLLTTGRQPFVVTDAVSAGPRDQIEPAFCRMRDAGAILTGVISAMYELLGDATHPAFRECLKLAKSVHV